MSRVSPGASVCSQPCAPRSKRLNGAGLQPLQGEKGPDTGEEELIQPIPVGVYCGRLVDLQVGIIEGFRGALWVTEGRPCESGPGGEPRGLGRSLVVQSTPLSALLTRFYIVE